MATQQTNTHQSRVELQIGDKTLAATLEVLYLREVLDALPREQKTALDVGAHRGEVTGELLARGMRVICVEPQDFLVERLEQRFAAELGDGRLKLERCAASDRRGTAALYLGSASTVSSLEEEWTTIAFPEEFRSPRRVEVPLVPAAELLARHAMPQLGFAKIDVEGHELPALRGLLASESSAAPAMVMFEASHCFADRAESCIELLWSRGYRTFDLFIRWGIDPIAGERFTSPKLPSAWHACGTRNFYANVIAYHGEGPKGIGKLNPAWFVRHYQVKKSQDLLRRMTWDSDSGQSLATDMMAGGWEDFPNHPIARHFAATETGRLLDDLRASDGRLPRRVVEIGGGIGASARTYLGAEPNAAYVIVDLPERLAVQHFRLTVTMPHIVVEFAEGPEARPRPGQVLLVTPRLAQSIASGPELLFSTESAEGLSSTLRRLVTQTDGLGATRVRVGRGPAVARRPWGGARGIEVCGAD
jgi:FkbM family methyltransferase